MFAIPSFTAEGDEAGVIAGCDACITSRPITPAWPAQVTLALSHRCRDDATGRTLDTLSAGVTAPNIRNINKAPQCGFSYCFIPQLRRCGGIKSWTMSCDPSFCSSVRLKKSQSKEEIQTDFQLPAALNPLSKNGASLRVKLYLYCT